ncbi:MAG: 2-isopropylmalate synthase, partial [Pseudomonadota bacterium]
MDQVIIFDTTLRDGEQSPGFSMSPSQKLRMARTLRDLGVDVIEAGFPAASPGDFESVQTIAREVQGPAICGLARCNEGDIRTVARAIAPAAKQRIHVFIATSPIHREHKLKMTREEVVAGAVAGVKLAKSLVDDVEFSAEDAIRTEPEFLAEVLTAAIDAGAGTVNIPDTVGYTTPDEMTRLITYIRENVPNIDQAIISTHCHDDLGMAVANSLAAISAGARQIECTINGIGERAGNASLEEVVMALKTRPDHFGCDTAINTQRLVPASRLLAAMTGNIVPRNKAIVGDNAFAHESGIHQHGMLSHSTTYEIMKPEDVGVANSQLVLGKHSGRHAVLDRARQLGYTLEPEQVSDLFARFKDLADRKREVYDADLEALITGQEGSTGPWQLTSLRVTTGLSDDPTASVAMSREGETHREAAIGDGPLDAVCRAMIRATGIDIEIKTFALRSVSEGVDAQGEANIHADFNGEELAGHGVSTDIVAAGAMALLQIINRITRRSERQAT